MYIIGQTNKKFVVAPELGRLLTQDAIERRERAEQAKKDEELKAIRIKEEEQERQLAAAKKKAAGPAGAPKKPVAPKARPKPAAKPSAPKPAAKPAATK